MKSCRDWFHPHVIPDPHYLFLCRVQKEMFSTMFMLFLSMQWKQMSLKRAKVNYELFPLFAHFMNFSEWKFLCTLQGDWIINDRSECIKKSFYMKMRKKIII